MGRLVDEDMAIKIVAYECGEFAGLAKRIEKQIKALPSVQSEIVRSKDCKYMTEHYDTDGNVPYWTCSEWDSGTDYDGFCHYAERRQDEQTD